MHSDRYGDLQEIASKTNGKCHLCHEPVDLAFYGPTGSFGEETTTVDHLIPQRFGGSDHTSNLLLAHGSCNSRRGTREPEDVRMQLVGKSSAPMSAVEKNSWRLVGCGVLALGAGYAFGERRADGEVEFNGNAAVWGGLLGLLLGAA